MPSKRQWNLLLNDRRKMQIKWRSNWTLTGWNWISFFRFRGDFDCSVSTNFELFLREEMGNF